MPTLSPIFKELTYQFDVQYFMNSRLLLMTPYIGLARSKINQCLKNPFRYLKEDTSSKNKDTNTLML